MTQNPRNRRKDDGRGQGWQKTRENETRNYKNHQPKNRRVQDEGEKPHGQKGERQGQNGENRPDKYI